MHAFKTLHLYNSYARKQMQGFGLVRERHSTGGASIITPRPGGRRTGKEHAPFADSTVVLIRDHRDTEIDQQVTVAVFRAVAMTTQLLENPAH